MNKVTTLGDYLKLNNLLNSIRAKGLIYKDARTFLKNKKALLTFLELDIATIEELKKAFFETYKGKLTDVHGKELKDMNDKAKAVHAQWLESQKQLEEDIGNVLSTETSLEFKEKLPFSKFSRCTVEGKDGTLIDNLSADELNLLIDLFCTDS